MIAFSKFNNRVVQSLGIIELENCVSEWPYGFLCGQLLVHSKKDVSERFGIRVWIFFIIFFIYVLTLVSFPVPRHRQGPVRGNRTHEQPSRRSHSASEGHRPEGG